MAKVITYAQALRKEKAKIKKDPKYKTTLKFIKSEYPDLDKANARKLKEACDQYRAELMIEAAGGDPESSESDVLDRIKGREIVDGDNPLSELNEVDSLILSRFSYFPLDGLFFEDKKITIKDAYSRALSIGIEERRIFTKSFATKSEFIKCSFLSKSFPAVCARLFLFFLSILSRSLFIPKKALSEIEKSIERTIKITRIIISTYEGYSSILLVNLQKFIQLALLNLLNNRAYF